MSERSKIEIFEDEIRRIISNDSLQKDRDCYKCIVDNNEQLTAFLVKIKEYGMDYSVRESYLNRARKGYRLLWQMQGIEYKKTPFIVRNVIKKHCIVGPLYYKKSKQEINDHPAGRKKRFQMQPTKKSGCPATMKIVHITTYPQYSGKTGRCSRAQALEELKTRLGNADEDLVKEDKWFITLTQPSGHSHSSWSCFLNQSLDERLKKEIEGLLCEGITNIRTVQISLKKFVRQKISPDIPTSARSFYPTRRIIYNYVLKHTYQCRISKIDQVALRNLISQWEISTDGGKFYLRDYVEGQSKFMFCYQSEAQACLMNYYGEICLLDATYKTTKYALPLFLLVVKANIGYMVVGLFVIQFEDSSSIAEALSVFKAWNSEWSPKYFVVDFSEAEMNAIKEVFVCAAIHICDFHTQQSWVRWFKKKENMNNSDDAKIMLKYFRKISSSKNEEEFSVNTESMYECEEWERNTKVQHYWFNTWLPHKEKWIDAFFSSSYSFIVNTNNGVESQNRLLKHSYLKEHSTDKSLCGVLSVIIEEFLPDQIIKYKNANSRLSSECKAYNSELPEFLYNRPAFFIKHAYQRYATAKSVYNKNDIIVLHNEDKRVCIVKSETRIKNHFVDFSTPNCTCQDFFKYRFPCKHMFAVILYMPDEFSFNSFPESYLTSPYISIHSEYSLFELDF